MIEDLLMDCLPSSTLFGRSCAAESDADRPARAEAEAAVRTILRWIGEDPDRDGLRDTPRRVVEAYSEYCAGYLQSPEQILSRDFPNENYKDLVIQRDIPFYSHCEHHLAPITGVAHVAYLPGQNIVGLSKLARLVHVFARRLQNQERMTTQIAEHLFRVPKALGAGVVIEARHSCVGLRGVRAPASITVTRSFYGELNTERWQQAFLMQLRPPAGRNLGV